MGNVDIGVYGNGGLLPSGKEVTDATGFSIFEFLGNIYNIRLTRVPTKEHLVPTF